MLAVAWARLDCLSATPPDTQLKSSPPPAGVSDDLTATAQSPGQSERPLLLAEHALSSSYAALASGLLSSPAQFQPLQDLRLLAFNKDMAQVLNLPSMDAFDWAELFHRPTDWRGAQPVAMAYAGHQFGNWVPALGDGRALLLGELADTSGQTWDIHLKGSGTTEYSRGFDGRAVTRSSVREYLAGEAMAGLDVASTRSLALFASSTPVMREQQERAALLVRLSKSMVRFGSFEWMRAQAGIEGLETLADYLINRYHPDLMGKADAYQALFAQMVRATAQTIADWHVWGFCHGVMNTDNMSVLGDTLDYGPYGFLDTYIPGFVCNTSDAQGRYSYQRQAQVGLWNCRALISACVPLIARECGEPEPATGGTLTPRLQEVLDVVLGAYPVAFWDHYYSMMLRRLGLHQRQGDEEDKSISEGFLGILASHGMDYHRSFRDLCEIDVGGDISKASAQLAKNHPDATKDLSLWLGQWRERLADENEEEGQRRAQMKRANPCLVLRNHLAQLAIEDAERDGDLTQRFAEALLNPWEEPADLPKSFTEAPPTDLRTIPLSCSA